MEKLTETDLAELSCMSAVLESGVGDEQANFYVSENPTNFQKAPKVTKMAYL